LLEPVPPRFAALIEQLEVPAFSRKNLRNSSRNAISPSPGPKPTATWGLKFVSRSWFNLDATWAISLILVGALSLAIMFANEH
jgi:hypothetical protein